MSETDMNLSYLFVSLSSDFPSVNWLVELGVSVDLGLELLPADSH